MRGREATRKRQALPASVVLAAVCDDSPKQASPEARPIQPGFACR
jgi:hypothetical protein